MSVLRNIESKLESLFEGVFGRAFRTNVQPVELARKLIKEMDDHRNVSVSRVYVPNEYTIFLSPGDREQFSSYEAPAEGRAAGVPRRARAPRELRRCSRRRRSSSTPTTTSTSACSASRRGWCRPASVRADEPQSQPEPGATMVYKPTAGVPQPTEAASAVELGIEREIARPLLGRPASRDHRPPGRARPLEGRRPAASPTRTPRAATRSCGRRARRTGCRSRLDERRRGQGASG